MTEERTEYTTDAQRIAELEAQVQRLEADKRRLRHLDSMPVDALERYIYGEYNSDSDIDSAGDWKVITAWLNTLDGAA